MPISAPFVKLPSTKWEAKIFSVTVFAIVIPFDFFSFAPAI
jgi:hypothetical protein